MSEGRASSFAAPAVEPEIRYESISEGATKVALVLGGEEVSRAAIVPLTIRVGTATLRMDAITGVRTAEEHLRRGYSRRVMEAAVRRMRAGDAALSMLWGIPDFYPKFGYTTVGPEHVLRLVDLSYGATLPGGWRSRAFALEDLAEVGRLYERTAIRGVGAVVRGPDSPAWSRLEQAAGRADECRVVEDPSGDVVAYAWRGRGGGCWMERWQREEPRALVFGEVIAAGPEAADAVLSVCRSWAAEQASEWIGIAAPPEGPVALAAMLQGARFEQHYARAAQFMGRSLGTYKLLAALRPELEGRLRGAGPRIAGTLRIGTEEGVATLLVGPDGISVQAGSSRVDGEATDMPQSELTRLALGAFPPEELLARLPVPPDGKTMELLAALFPSRNPHIYPVDRVYSGLQVNWPGVEWLARKPTPPTPANASSVPSTTA